MRNVAFLVYHAADHNVFETCIKTLRAVSPGCHIMVHFTDSAGFGLIDKWMNQYNLIVKLFPVSDYIGRRAYFKIECIVKLVNDLETDVHLMVADVDTVFLTDPFQAFEDEEFDLAVTTRGYKYPWPVNGGVFFIKVSEKMRKFMEWHKLQCLDPTWSKYIEARKIRGCEKYGLDWAVGQDFLNAVYDGSDWVLHRHGIVVKDVGFRYNYCPGKDTFGEHGMDRLLKEAYRTKAVSVLHFKSASKDLYYKGWLKEFVTKHERGPNDWMEVAGVKK